MPIGENIRLARIRAGLTQVELAKKAGIAVNSLRLYEAGKREPKIDTLLDIAEASGVYVEELLPNREKDILNFGFIQGCIEADSEMRKRDRQNNELVKTIIDSVWKPSEKEWEIIAAFGRLNDEGQQEAIKRVEELGEISRYQKKSSDASTEENSDRQ